MSRSRRHARRAGARPTGPGVLHCSLAVLLGTGLGAGLAMIRADSAGDWLAPLLIGASLGVGWVATRCGLAPRLSAELASAPPSKQPSAQVSAQLSPQAAPKRIRTATSEQPTLAARNTEPAHSEEDRLTQLRQQLVSLQAEYELQDQVFAVSAELVGCVAEADARQRFAGALTAWWQCRAADLLVWERGSWRSLGGPTHGAEPTLAAPVQFPAHQEPGQQHTDLVLDLSPAVDGQAAIVLRDALPQPVLADLSIAQQQYLAEVLRGQLALSLRRVTLFQQLQQLGRTDPLTGCYRRWYGEQRLSELVQRGQMLTVAMLDIDWFKRINDRFGHASGDHVLQAVGTAIRNDLRSGDLACRFGGEEFIVVLPVTGVAGAALVAERLRQRIARLADMPATVTVSVGLAALRLDESLSSLVNRADQALYQAKADGRNQVVLAEGDELDEHSLAPVSNMVIRTTRRITASETQVTEVTVRRPA